MTNKNRSKRSIRNSKKSNRSKRSIRSSKKSNRSKKSIRNSKKSNRSTKKSLKNIKLSKQLITDYDIKELFLENCKENIKKNIKKSKINEDDDQVKFNEKNLTDYCKCLSNKINLKSLKNIDMNFYNKCIKKSRKSSRKRLTKYYTNKYKKSLLK